MEPRTLLSATMPDVSTSDLKRINQNMVDAVYNYWNQASPSDNYYFSNGQWVVSSTPGTPPNAQYCTTGIADDAAILWREMATGTPALNNTTNLLTRSQYLAIVEQTFDYQIANYQYEGTTNPQDDGGWVDAPGDTTTDDVGGEMFTNMFAEAYMEVAPGLDASHVSSWKASLEQSANEQWNVEHNYYINGNVNLGQTLDYYQLWLITGNATYYSDYQYEYNFTMNPDATANTTKWAGAGLIITKAPTQPDDSDGQGYLAESGAEPFGYDPEYTGTLQLDWATRLYQLSQSEQSLQLVNLLMNQTLTEVNSSYQLNTSGGTRHDYPPGRLIDWDTPAYAALYWQNDRQTYSANTSAELAIMDSDERSSFNNYSPNSMRGAAIEMGEAFLCTQPAITDVDTMSLSGTRSNGAALNGLSTEVGAAPWVATSNITLENDGTSYYAGVGTGNNSYAGFAVNNPSAPVDIQAQLKPSGVGSGQWISMGLQSSIGVPMSNYTGQIWLTIRANGAYTIFADGTTYTLGTGTVPSFNSTGFTAAEIQYVPSSKSLTVLLNGTAVLNNDVLTGFTPVLNDYVTYENGSPDPNRTSDPGFNMVEVSIASPAGVIDSDTLSPTGARTNGEAVNGLTTEVGGATWNATSTTTLESNTAGTYAGFGSGNNADAGFAVANPAAPIELSAQLKVSGAASNQWVSMGLQSSIGAPMSGTAGQIWLLIRTSGAYTIYADGTTYTLGSGTVPSFSSTGFTASEIEYTPATKSVTVILNGATVLNNDILTGFTPVINDVVFYENGTPDPNRTSDAGFDDVLYQLEE